MEKLTIRNIIQYAAIVLGVVSVFLMFGAQTSISGGLFQVRDPYFYEYYFGSSYLDFNGNIVGFIGYMLALVATVVAIVMIFSKASIVVKNYVGLGVIVFYIAAGVLIFLQATVANALNTNTFELLGCAITAGVFTLVAGVAYCVSLFFNTK